MKTRYMPNIGETYDKYVAEGIKSIRGDLDGEIFWGPTDRGRAFAARVGILKNKERIYNEKLTEGRREISKELDEQIFWGPTDRGRALAHRTSILRKKLDNDPFFSDN